MDSLWIGMFVVWGVVELIQYLRKKPFPQRMKTGAVWGVVVTALGIVGQSQKDSGLLFMVIAFLFCGVVASIVYLIRLQFAKIWAKKFAQPADSVNLEK